MAYNSVCQVHCLSLNNLRCLTKIGFSEQERSTPQYMRFDIQIRFSDLPAACLTDRLNDTVCYQELSNKVREICNHSEFKLIERLAWQVFAALKESLPPNIKLGLRTTKEKPPISGLEGGSTFYLGEWSEF